MQHKVKYTRKEYREEYLNSEEWKNLRNTIMSSEPDCQCCGKKASDVHHMVYRNIVDIKITDLIPVCRTCHDYIHEAIDNNWISQNPKDITEIVRKTINILHDEEYKKFAKWLKAKHLLEPGLLQHIMKAPPVVIRKISGIIKRHIWYDTLAEMKFTGKQIKKIGKIVAISTNRKHRPVILTQEEIKILQKRSKSDLAKADFRPKARTITQIRSQRKKVGKLRHQQNEERRKLIVDKFKDEIAALPGREREEFIRQKISESYN